MRNYFAYSALLAASVSAYTSAPPPAQTTAVQEQTCPPTYNKDCRFLCRQNDGSLTCNPGWTAARCTLCPSGEGKCPSAPDPECAYLCPVPEGGKYCHNAPNVYVVHGTPVTCEPCGGQSGGNSTVTSAGPPAPPTDTPTEPGSNSTHTGGNPPVPTETGTDGTPTKNIPEPTYSSSASILNLGSAALVGLLAMAFIF